MTSDTDVPAEPRTGEERARFLVEAASHSYSVLIGRGLLRRLPVLLAETAPSPRYALIADETVAELYGSTVLEDLGAAGLHGTAFTFPPGERSKNRDEWARLSDALVGSGFGRDGVVISMGGGVTGDLAGFVAATYMRGVPVVQVPTSMVAMVDASVGGKTGLDIPAGKNLVGAFHPPQMVVIDPLVASTLSERERAEGLVEAVKHGAIVDVGYFDQVERLLPAARAGDGAAIESVVEGSVAIKSGIVSQDEKEGGIRQILNFGHTLGHAIEAASGFDLSHGAAVALGMILEARLGERMEVTPSGTAARLTAVLRRLNMPDVLPDGMDADAILRFTAIDKKGRRGAPRYVLLEAIGAVAHAADWAREIPEADVRGVLS